MIDMKDQEQSSRREKRGTEREREREREGGEKER